MPIRFHLFSLYSYLLMVVLPFHRLKPFSVLGTVWLSQREGSGDLEPCLGSAGLPHLSKLFTLSFFFPKILFIFRERGREGEREGEKHWCVRETSISCLSHAQPRTWPATQVCALTGNQTSDLLVWGTMLNPWTTPARAKLFTLQALVSSSVKRG